MIAYFCTEFALDNKMPTYAGGLGVLAGDFVKEAAREKFPLVAVGLYYHQGYAQNTNTYFSPGKVIPEDLGLKQVLNAQKEPVLVSVPIQDRQILAKAWQWQEGPVTVYLLDTEVEENTPLDRIITNQLYVNDKEIRMKQEMILGIGGFRLLHALGLQPEIYHLNEGHSAFLILELIKDLMGIQKIDFDHARELARKKIVFTNHTLVAAGQEIYSTDLFSAIMFRYAESLGIPLTEVMNLGQIPESNLFSMTLLSIRLAGKINAVSALHAEEATKIWADQPMKAITNGIFFPRWDFLKTDKPEEIWQKHQTNKKKLLTLIKEKTTLVFPENTLLLGWGRRIVPYKRPLAIFDNPEKFKKLANDSHTPLRLIFAGLAHNDDEEGIKLFEELQRLSTNELKDLVVYLPGYGLSLSQTLIPGCDVWLNTPVVKSEACGTSGMKASLNGVLPLTTNDGWVAEVDLNNIGWIVENQDLGESLLATLEKNIIPEYAAHLKNPDHSSWTNKMSEGRKLILQNFGMNRVLEDYKKKLYNLNEH